MGGEASAKGGKIRTYRCREGNCTDYGYQYDAKLPELPKSLKEASNLDKMGEIHHKPGRLVLFLGETLHDITQLYEGTRDVMLAFFSCTPTLSNGALFWGHPPLVEYLVSQRADVTAADENRVSRIQEAARHGHAQIVQLLASAGAQVDAADRSGWRAL